MEAEAPDAIGFSARSTNNWLIPVLIPIFREVAPHALLIAGGFGPTLEPELYLDGGFDCVIRCDGEEALARLLSCLETEKTGVIQDDKQKIKNTVWKKNEKYIFNPLFPQEKDLSKYGEPLHGDKYFSFINNGELRRHYDPEMHTQCYLTYFGRGCIGHCTYCSGGQWSLLYKQKNTKVYKRRNRDIAELISELQKIPDNINHIWFVDEYFGLSGKKTLEFCKQYKEKIGKTFFTYINYDYMLTHRDIFYALVDAGLSGTGVGFQTGSEKFSREQYHRNLSNKTLLEFANLCFETNLYTGIHLIGGNCYETEEVFQETVNLVRALPFSLEDPWRAPLENIRLRPHPKTPITFLSPKVVTAPMSAQEWFYRAVLLELARILDEDEFENIRRDKYWYNDPVKLNRYFSQRLMEKQWVHYTQLGQDLQGKRIVYYGCGELYQANKAFFSDLHAEAILVDSPFAAPASIDGIPIYDADDFLKNNKDDDIIFITWIKGSSLPQRRKLNFRYGVKNEYIHNVIRVL